MTRAHLWLGVAGFAVAVACSDPNAIPDASLTNEVDTLTLWALDGGPLTRPTAYSLNARSGVRTWDVGTNFEFAFTVDPAGRPVLLPLEVLGLASSGSLKPGLKPSTLTFDGMKRAPLNGYITTDTIPADSGGKFFIRTGVNSCASYGVPLYGKLEILYVDTVADTLSLRVVANQNCAYRDLDLGIPKD
jgi:hypothetical protein